MLKDFWQDNNAFIQFTGILVAIGALFLNIPVPIDNELAKDALQNVQFILLVLVSILVSFLLYRIARLILEIEIHTSKKLNINTDETLFLIALTVFGFAVVHLWFYTFAIFPNALISLMNTINLIIGVVSLNLGWALAQKYFHKLGKSLLFPSAAFGFFYALVYVPWNFLRDMAQHAIREPLNYLISAGVIFSVGFLLYLVAYLFIELIARHRQKWPKLASFVFKRSVPLDKKE